MLRILPGTWRNIASLTLTILLSLIRALDYGMESDRRGVVVWRRRANGLRDINYQ
jgi:hypothetical protein